MAWRTEWLGDGESVGYDKMRLALEGGGKVVVGTMVPCDPGQAIRPVREMYLVVKRRATRQDFLDSTAAAPPEVRGRLASVRAPFYYELELMSASEVQRREQLQQREELQRPEFRRG